MEHAYLIMAHADPDQLHNLIKSLDATGVTFFVHIDAKAAFDPSYFEDKLPAFADIYFIEDRNAINWGGFYMTETTLQLLKTCCSVRFFDYISLLSGQDYPLQPPKAIEAFLSQGSVYGKNFLEYNSLPYPNWPGNGGMHRFEYYWLMDDLDYESNMRFLLQQQRDQTVSRKLPLGLIPYGGSQWFTITHEAALYLNAFVERHPELLDFFRYTFISDELMIPTLLMNSPFTGSIVNDNLRHIDWTSPTGKNPKYFMEADYDALMASNKLFSRKFDSSYSKELIRRIQSGWEQASPINTLTDPKRNEQIHFL